jgi:hypothetical protein
MRRMTKALVVGLAIVVVGAFFLLPVVYYNPPNKLGNFSGYESLSCALLNIGISYGYNSFHATSWALMISCGFIHV